ncbi:hypothetical protein RVR_2461 [Actinacidiphila reveromycinica]|uniref:HTH-like domain-containing protein n=2 Tax=Actinacidiphila reveromycinica TaxID=659352 RepID=A0A7U3VMT2_9ACTN|nr:hypothetical protein RVR_2461 [Streptomyces sp. SN-593]
MINHLRDDFGVEPVCPELDLPVSAYNARRQRLKSARRQRDEQLMEHIHRIHDASGETYGARRIHRRLRREGIITARCAPISHWTRWRWCSGGGESRRARV